MKPFVERMLEEYYELDARLRKLQEFSISDKFAELEKEEQDNLTKKSQESPLHLGVG